MKDNRIVDLQHPGFVECAKRVASFVRVGIAADRYSQELMCRLVAALEMAGHEIIEFPTLVGNNRDGYADSLVPLAESVAIGEVTKGVAIFSSGVGASIVSNKVPGVRAAFITDSFSAHQGVEDDAMNLMCIGSQVTGHSLAWELVQIFIAAHFHDGVASRARPSGEAWLERQSHSLQKAAK